VKRLFDNVGKWFPFLLIAAVFAWASISIFTRRAESIPADKKVIRLGHWQLEPGIRAAIDQMAAEYEKLHPDVRIIQDAIPDQSYAQWLTTQLIGGTAPDLVEAGQLPSNLLTTFYLRYFLPVTAVATKPNPYNVGTDLENVPLFQTFRDGMRSSFIDEAQQFMKVPLSAVGTRIFYNKDLLKKLTGLDELPMDYRMFLKACETISKQKAPDGSYYVPIAGSAYHLGMWDGGLFQPATYMSLDDTDLNADGFTSKEELFLSFMTGKVDMTHPAYRGRLRILGDLSPFFPSGYTGLNRDDAVMLIAKQKAVMVSIGTWDASSLFEQANGKFAAGFSDFPTPSANDPEYGKLFPGRRSEPAATGDLPFAVTRTSKHPEIAIDFLLFLTGQKTNEKFNKLIGWIPAVRGAHTDESLKAFEPHYIAVYSTFDPNIGAETPVRWNQLFALFQVGQISLEDFSREFETFYRSEGRRDFEEFIREMRRGLLRDEQLAVQLRVSAMHTSPDDLLAPAWVRYRKAVLGRVLGQHTYVRMLELTAKEGKTRLFRDPNTYSTTARTNIRNRGLSVTPVSTVTSPRTNRQP